MKLMKKTHVVERLGENRIEYIIELWKDSHFTFKGIEKQNNLKYLFNNSF